MAGRCRKWWRRGRSCLGTATAATYNTSTGVGSRVNFSNRSYVSFAGLTTGAIYAMTVVNTGSTFLLVRTNNSNTALATISPGQTATVYIVVAAGNASVDAATDGTTATFTVTSFKLLPGAHMYQSSAGSQPKLRQNATTGAYYLECDGSDDGMVTPSLDLSATDKVAVFTACRKLSDAAAGVFLEFSASSSVNNGAFGYFTSATAGGAYSFRSRGYSSSDVAATGYIAPTTSVLTGIANPRGDTAILRVNGAQVGSSPTDQGDRDFSNYPLYYFRRGGSSLPFNGYYYGDIIFAGTPTPAQIAWAEAYYNRLSGAY